MKYLIADLVVEYEPRYELLNSFLEKFTYHGTRPTNIKLTLSDEYLSDLLSRMTDTATPESAESFGVGNMFFKRALKFDTMLVHSSAVLYKGEAILFSAMSGVGKSTHTRLWKQAFGTKVSILNDDKPALRIIDGNPIVFGTPFDGGSGIAENGSAPLRAIVFINRAEENSVRVPGTTEVLQNLYFSTVHMLSDMSAEAMLSIFDKLITTTKFYVLNCNMDISAAYTAFDAVVGND